MAPKALELKVFRAASYEATAGKCGSCKLLGRMPVGSGNPDCAGAGGGGNRNRRSPVHLPGCRARSREPGRIGSYAHQSRLPRHFLPAAPNRRMELVQRLRFDIVFCSIGLPGLNWIEFSEDVRSRIGAFVLLTEAFDFDLSRGMLSGEANVLTRPFSDTELDRLLGTIETKLTAPETNRRLQVIRPEKRAISL